MSGKDPNKSVSERHYSADVNSLTPVYLKLDLTLHSNADGKPNEQLQRMLDRKRPWDGNGKPLSARRQTQPCNTKGPGESQPPVSADNGHHEACPCGCGFCSGKHLESLATDLVHGQINHVIVTGEVLRQFTGRMEDPSDDG
ncbi:hypothetical protein BGW41_002243 [Actinomortierella wolfii]|nr:hypothetical protein BGW41_002243 [Actinomortierella wolfii]